MGLAKINIKFSADLRGFSTEMQNSIRRVGALGKELQNTGKNLSTYLSLPLAAAGAAAVKFASDYNESLNKVDVAFGSSSQNVREFAKTSLESFGIAEGTALDMAANFGDMATSLGLPVEKAAAMSKSLVGLAGDLASFKNISIDVANTALSGIFTGETESLKKLGIVMTEANLKAFAFSQGIQKPFDKMSQGEKTALRYNYILSVTKNAQGDFERTGGGAANQMRIFQESLKQVGQQLGTVILPAFTRLITFVNGAIKSFSGLSDGTKTTIVAIAGVAAAIGPLLTVTGSLLTFVPNLITKFNALKDVITGFGAVIAANPITALAIGLAALTTYLVVSNSRFSQLTNATKEFASINIKAAESIAKESSELNQNLAIAKNNVYSKETRKKAIEALNALSPEYLGNLTLENINTQKTTQAVNEYNDALLRKARVQAAEEKMVEVQKKLLDLQLGNLEAIKPSVWQNFGNAILSAGNSAYFTARSAQSVSENFGIEYKELLKLQAGLSSFIGSNKDYKKSNDQSNLSLENTIGNHQTLIKEREKLVAISAAPLMSSGTIDELDREIAKLEEFKNKIASTPELVEIAKKKIEALELFKALKLDPESVIKTADSIDEMAKRLAASAANIKSTVVNLNDQVSSSVQDLAKNLYVSLAETIGAMIAGVGTSMNDIFVGLSNVVSGFLKGLGEAMIQAGLAGLALKAAFSNPFATIAAGFALVAFSSAMSSAMKSSQAFADGGIVGGTSFYGDKILARVNSGELILNNKQQAALYGQLNNGSGSSDSIIPNVRISGQDLLVVFDRAKNKKNRLG